MMSKDELQELAAQMFDKYGVDKLYGTTDGNIFIMHNRAALHAGSKLTIYTLLKPADSSDPQEKELNETTDQYTIRELKEALKGMEDPEVIREWLGDEVGGQNRKGAVNAIEERLGEVVSTTKAAENTTKTATETKDDKKILETEEGTKTPD